MMPLFLVGLVGLQGSSTLDETVQAHLSGTSKELQPLFRSVILAGKKSSNDKLIKKEIAAIFDRKVTFSNFTLHNYQTFRDIKTPFMEKSIASFYKHKFVVNTEKMTGEEYKYVKECLEDLYQGAFWPMGNGWHKGFFKIPEYEIAGSGVSWRDGTGHEGILIYLRKVNGHLKISGMTYYEPIRDR